MSKIFWLASETAYPGKYEMLQNFSSGRQEAKWTKTRPRSTVPFKDMSNSLTFHEAPPLNGATLGESGPVEVP